MLGNPPAKGLSIGLQELKASESMPDIVDTSLLGLIKQRKRLHSPGHLAECENGLFLVGDGVQTIYRRGFSLRNAGIAVANRSFVMKKNYRNTQEVLCAAFGLIEHYEIADVDEDNIVRPTEPDFPKRHGEKPIILKCRSLTD